MKEAARRTQFCHNLHHTRYILMVLTLVCNGSGDEVPGRYKWGSMVNKWHWDRLPLSSCPSNTVLLSVLFQPYSIFSRFSFTMQPRGSLVN